MENCSLRTSMLFSWLFFDAMQIFSFFFRFSLHFPPFIYHWYWFCHVLKLWTLFLVSWLQEGDECILFRTCRCQSHSKALWQFWRRGSLFVITGAANSGVCLNDFIPSLLDYKQLSDKIDKLALDLQWTRYDQVLKASHAFNILDSRGFVGVTERARYFGRMRRCGTISLVFFLSYLIRYHGNFQVPLCS